MISIAYVNGYHEPLFLSDPSLKFESYLDSLLEESNNAYGEYIEKYNQVMFESVIYGENEENHNILVTESENVFSKIGNAIINAIKAFKEYVTKIIDKMRGFEKKSDFDKLQEATKSKDPEVQKAMMDAFNRGDLTVYDAKSIKEIEDAYLALIKSYKDNGIDPNTFKGKCELFKKKIQEADKSAIVKGAQSISLIAGGIVALPLIKKHLNDIKLSNMNLSKSAIDRATAQAEAYEQMRNSSDADIKAAADPKNGKTIMMHNIDMYMLQMTEKFINKNDTTYHKIMDGVKKVINVFDKSGKGAAKIDKAVDKHDAKDIKAAEKFANASKNKADAADTTRETSKKQALGKHDAEVETRETKRKWNREDVSDRKSAEHQHDRDTRDEKREWNRQDASDKSKAQNKSELEFNNRHKKQIQEIEYGKAAAQQRARNDFAPPKETPDYENQAYQQARGRRKEQEEYDRKHPDKMEKEMKKKAEISRKIREEQEKKKKNNTK